VRTAFSVGTGTRRTVVKYAFKNAAIPTVTVLGLQLAALIGGVVIIEQIFSIPGLGTYMLRALTLPDVPVIQAVTITFVVIYVVLNLIVDISYGYLNPRVRPS
jgi:peptide/nickel transport system permease protein